MNAPRSWNTLLLRLAGALTLAALALACGAGTATARRNVDLGAPESSNEAAPAGEAVSSPPEAPPAEPAPPTRHARRPSCGVSLEGPRELSAGEAPVVKGQLTCAEAGEAAGQSVQLFEHSAGTPGFAEAATALTEPDGSFTATLALLETNSFIYARLGRARSPRLAIRVSPLVTLAGPAYGAVLTAARHARAQAPIHFTGTVSPADGGAPVTLQRERPLGSGQWRRVAGARVADDGSFAFAHSFHAAGPLVLRASVRRHAHRLAAVSETLSYEVTLAQNPALTISLSPQTVAFGETVTIAGKLAGPAGSPVALLGRSGGGAYTALATTTTTEGGAYTFAQTPSRETEYRVRSGAERSLPVRAFLTFALTASPSPSAVTEGEGVAISGTVAPASPGAHVYLQRLARSGISYAVLGFATVGADSTFQIDVPPAPAGTASYRVRIGRTAGLAGTVTPPIAVTTAAGP